MIKNLLSRATISIFNLCLMINFISINAMSEEEVGYLFRIDRKIEHIVEKISDNASGKTAKESAEKCKSGKSLCFSKCEVSVDKYTDTFEHIKTKEISTEEYYVVGFGFRDDNYKGNQTFLLGDRIFIDVKDYPLKKDYKQKNHPLSEGNVSSTYDGKILNSKSVSGYCDFNDGCPIPLNMTSRSKVEISPDFLTIKSFEVTEKVGFGLVEKETIKCQF